MFWGTWNTQREAKPAQKPGAPALMSSRVWVIRKLTNYQKGEHKSIGHSARHTCLSIHTYPNSSINWGLSPMLKNALHSAIQWSQYGQGQHNSKYSALFLEMRSPSQPQLTRNWKEAAALSSPLTLTWSSDMQISTAQHFQYFYPFQKGEKRAQLSKLDHTQKRFLALKPYSHFITSSTRISFNIHQCEE